MATLALIPHQDDESLFLAYTLMRERPFVLFCTYPVIQEKRGLEATTSQRLNEAHEAMSLLGLNYDTLILNDDEVTKEALVNELRKYTKLYDKVYAPAIEGYQKQHDMVGEAADILWENVIHYMTYTKENLHTQGSIEITPTSEEIILKDRLLDCYTSQLKYNLPHFNAVRGLPEYYA